MQMYGKIRWICGCSQIFSLTEMYKFQYRHQPPIMHKYIFSTQASMHRFLQFYGTPYHALLDTIMGSWWCGCLVTWFCYQLIAELGNKVAVPWWSDPWYYYTFVALGHTVYMNAWIYLSSLGKLQFKWIHRYTHPCTKFFCINILPDLSLITTNLHQWTKWS